MLKATLAKIPLSARIPLIGVGGLILSIQVLVLYAQNRALEDVHNAASAELTMIVAHRADDLHRDIVSMEEQLQQLADELQAISHSDRALVQFLETDARDHGTFSTGLAMARGDQSLIVSTTPAAASPRLRNAALQALASEGRRRPIASMTTLDDGRLVLVLTTDILDGHGQSVGYIFGLVPAASSAFVLRIASDPPIEGLSLAVVDRRSHTIISASEASAQQTAPRVGTFPLTKPLLSAVWTTGIDNSTPIPSVTAAAPVTASDWYVAAALPVSRIDAPFRALAPSRWLYALVLSLPFGLLLWVAIHVEMRHLAGVIRALSMFGVADAKTVVVPETGPQDIRAMGSSINRLLRILAARDSALRASEQEKQAILDALPAAVALIDNDGRIMFANRTWTALGHDGYERGDLDEAEWFPRVGEALGVADRPDLRLLTDGLKQIRLGRSSGFAVDRVNHDASSPRHYALSVTAIAHGQVVACQHDITTRVESEQARRDSEELFREAADMSPLAIVMFEGMMPGSRVCRYVNAAWSRMLGYQLGDMGDEAELAAMVFDDIALREQMTARFAKPNPPAEPLAAWCRAKDGTRRFVSWYGPIVQGNRWWGFGLDLTDATNAQDSARVLARAIEQSSTMIEVADPAGRVVFANPAVTRTFGDTFAAPGHQQRLVTAMIEPGDAQNVALRRAIADGGEWTGFYQTQAADGRSVWIRASLTPIHDDQQTLVNFVVVKDDITERHQTEAYLLEAREAAERASRAKTDFISSVSHELRTPMNAVLGFAQTLAADDTLSPGQSASVEQIIAGGRHLHALINDVVDLAAIEAGELKTDIAAFDLLSEVRDCMALTADLIEKAGLTLEATLDNGGTAIGDARRFRQIILNLLSNAVKFNRPEGRITVRAVREGDRWWRIEVADEGPGIPKRHIADVFRPFSRPTSDRIAGSGLGMAISSQITEQMGGCLSVESTIGVGTTFVLYIRQSGLPAVPSISLDATPSGSATRDLAVGERPVVLCIDDSPSNLAVVRALLQRRGDIRLVTASTGADGLTEALAARPAIALIDINLTDMTGIEVLHRMRAQTALQGMVAVAVSADALTHDVDRAHRAGFEGYITKPILLKELMQWIDRALAQQREAPDTDIPPS